MKNSYLCLILFICFSFLFESCTTETSFPLKDDHITVETKKEIAPFTLRSGDLLPSNSNNPYDSAGRIHNELFEAYYALDSLPESITAIASRAESIANANIDFNTIKGINYQPVSTSRVAYIIAENNNSVSEVIANSNMSVLAKSSLTTFITTLISLSDTETSCEVFYDFVVDYEAGILNTTSFTEADKKIILTTASIARYSTYRDAKRPKKNTDPDWTIFVGNIIGGTDGASDGEAEALMKALVIGIVQNQ